MFIVKVFVLSLCIYLVSAHSWMQCADYTEENGRFWDASKCRGYPRGYGEKYQYHGYGFGNDAGYNTQPQENAVCQASFGTADMGGYNAPSYKPGQRVCMAWPPKNHVAARCNNININDFGTQILRSGVNPTRDPAFSEFQLVHDFGASQPGAGEGFQNCPDFCKNNDKALCTGCFNVPADLAQGKYVFLWLWEFNRGEKYTTCFDVTISNSVTSAPPTVLAKTTPDAFAAGGSAVTGNTGNTGAATGNTGNTGAATGNTGTATGTQNTGSNNNNDDGEVKTTKGKSGYSGGVIAAAVIVTFIAVAAIFVGVFWTARTFPHSKVGSFVHQLMSSK